MKYTFIAISLFCLLFFSSCDNMFKNKKMSTGTMNNPATPDGSNGEEMPEIKFDETEHDFGTINQNEVITYAFKFTNVGKADLLINNCTSTCGCTIPDWPRQPIRPGGTGFIDVRFDSKNKVNDVNKTVHVQTNCATAEHNINFHVFVRVPEKK